MARDRLRRVAQHPDRHGDRAAADEDDAAEVIGRRPGRVDLVEQGQRSRAVARQPRRSGGAQQPPVAAVRLG